MLRAHNFQARRSIGVQTGQNDEMVFYLSNKKINQIILFTSVQGAST